MIPRNVALARAFPILIGIIIFGGIIVLLALRTVRGVEQSEAVAARFDGLVARCADTEEDDVSEADVSEAHEAGALPGVAFRLVDGRWIYDGAMLPVAWRAEQAEEVRVVLCLGPAEPLVTTACEVDAGGVAPTRIYGEALRVRLVDAESGALLAGEVLRSAETGGCRDEVDVVRLDAGVITGWVRENVDER